MADVIENAPSVDIIWMNYYFVGNSIQHYDNSPVSVLLKSMYSPKIPLTFLKFFFSMYHSPSFKLIYLFILKILFIWKDYLLIGSENAYKYFFLIYSFLSVVTVGIVFSSGSLLMYLISSIPFLNGFLVQYFMAMYLQSIYYFSVKNYDYFSSEMIYKSHILHH